MYRQERKGTLLLWGNRVRDNCYGDANRRIFEHSLVFHKGFGLFWVSRSGGSSGCQFCFYGDISSTHKGVNHLLRMTVYPDANYFFTYGLEGNVVMDAFTGMIPIEFLWMMPLVLLMAVLCVCITGIAGVLNNLMQ